MRKKESKKDKSLNLRRLFGWKLFCPLLLLGGDRGVCCCVRMKDRASESVSVLEELRGESRGEKGTL